MSKDKRRTKIKIILLNIAEIQRSPDLFSGSTTNRNFS